VKKQNLEFPKGVLRTALIFTVIAVLMINGGIILAAIVGALVAGILGGLGFSTYNFFLKKKNSKAKMYAMLATIVYGIILLVILIFLFVYPTTVTLYEQNQDLV